MSIEGKLSDINHDNLKWEEKKKSHLSPSGQSLKGDKGFKNVPKAPTINYEEASEVESTTKLLREKAKSNPLIPLGMLATVLALGFGLKYTVSGDKIKSQLMMRYRIGAQGLTVIALVGGLLYTSYSASKDLPKKDG